MKRFTFLLLAVILSNLSLYCQKDLPVFAQYGSCFLNAGKCEEVFIKNNIAYIGSRAGLLILNISDPDNPEYINCYYTDKLVFNIFVKDTLAFVSSFSMWNPTLSIINLSDLNNPVLVHSFEVNAGQSYSIFATDDYLFIGTDSGLYIYDISNLQDPVQIAHLPDTDPRDMVVKDDYIYMVANSKYFGILDISNITDPELLCWIGNYSTSRNAIDLKGDYAYIAGKTFDIFDISNPSNPDQLCEINIGESSLGDLFLFENFCITSSDSLYAINIENPNSPEIVSYYPYNGKYLGFEDNILMVSKNFNYENPIGLGFFEIDELQQISPITEYITDEAKEVFVSGNYAYVANGYSGLKIINIAMPSVPYSVANCLKEYYVVESIVENDLAYVRTKDGLKIVDVSDPEFPFTVGGYDLFLGFTMGYDVLEKYGNYIFLGGSHDIYIINVSDPFNPYYAGLLDVYDWSPDIEIFEEHLYVAGYWGGFQIFDLVDPVNPQMIGYYPLDLALKVAAGEDMGFIGSGIFDLSDLTNPIYVGSYTSYGVTDMQCVDNYLFTTNRDYQDLNSGIRIINLSDLYNPLLKQEVLNIKPNGLYYINGNIYVVEDYRFRIFGDTLTVSLDDNFIYSNETELLCFPNPAKDHTTLRFQLNNESYVRLCVYNGNGKIIRTLYQDNLSTGNHSIIWDCINDSGCKVTPGIYIITLRFNHFHLSKKVIVRGY